MSFETQKRTNTCGIASLRYALSLLGVGFRNGNKHVTEKWLEKKIDRPWSASFDGYNEDELRPIAEAVGLKATFHAFMQTDTDAAIAELRRVTDLGHPCLVTWHDDGDNHFHWVCVGRVTDDQMIVFDPSLLDDGEVKAKHFLPIDKHGVYVPARMSRERFAEWIEPDPDDLEDEDEHHFFMEMEVDRESAAAERFRFVPGVFTPELLDAMKEDPDLYREFDEYIDDLRDIFGTEGPRRAHDLLVERREQIIEMVDGWVLDEACPRSFYEQEVDTLIALAKCYEFRIALGREAAAMANLGFYLGWRSCEYSFEVGRYE